jgi:hypothetical protein
MLENKCVRNMFLLTKVQFTCICVCLVINVVNTHMMLIN